jgi:hypothetical protein
MMTPPFIISAKPRLTGNVPVFSTLMSPAYFHRAGSCQIVRCILRGTDGTRVRMTLRRRDYSIV